MEKGKRNIYIILCYANIISCHIVSFYAIIISYHMEAGLSYHVIWNYIILFDVESITSYIHGALSYYYKGQIMIYSSFHLSIHLFIYLLNYLFMIIIHTHIHLSLLSSIYLFIYLLPFVYFHLFTPMKFRRFDSRRIL